MNAKTKLETMIARAETTLWLAGVVREAVRSEEGKPVSKRIATKVKKRIAELRPDLGDVLVYWKDDTSYSVCVWGGKTGIESRDRFSSSVAYWNHSGAERPVVSEAGWAEKNQCYLLNAERLPKYRDALAQIDALQAEHEKIEEAKRAFSAKLALYGCTSSLFDGQTY